LAWATYWASFSQTHPVTLFQTYILRLEVVLCGVQLAIQGLEFVFSFICLISFYG
jgi:hypothetical protein